MTNDTLMTQLRELDPAQDVQVADASWDEMLEQVTAGPIKRRTRMWRRPFVTIPALAVLSAGAFLLTTAVAGDKVIEVRAADALRDPRGLEQELARQGLDARIVAVPSEDLAGKWYAFYLEPGTDIDEDTFWLLKSYVGHLDARYPSVQERCPIGDCARTGLLEIPGRVKGPITLIVGRVPMNGEATYWADSFGMNELSPSGALWCYRLEEKSPAEAESILADLGYDVIWVHEDDNYSDEVSFPPADAEITMAWFRNPKIIDVRTATAEDVDLYRSAEGTPTQNHPRSSASWAPTCS